jgi:ferredoxin-thioredoxin reductase catalytic subunit
MSKNDNTTVGVQRVVTTSEVVSETWRTSNPRNCPVVLRDGDGKSVGACWCYLRDGACPCHGQIYENNKAMEKKEVDQK